MNKLLALSLVCGELWFSSNGMATQCDAYKVNLTFYAASIEEKGVTCQYRYCYYGCISDSYIIPGRFKPELAHFWKKDENGSYYCTSNAPNDCSFSYI